MSALDLARWQFAVTTLYHFLFVPVTIGLSCFVAGYETAWYRTRDERWLRLTRFFGKLLLINLALGVVTGIVQEFQFGMNWASYSRYVGDVFGTPLALEALAAFFLESTFIGLWIFGWDKLRPGVHLATIWAVAIGSIASAYFILAANSWMQHPVGYRLDETTGRAEMESIGEVFFQQLQLTHFVHTIGAALATAGLIVLAIAAYHLLRGRDVELFGAAARSALVVTVVASVVQIGAGHFQAQILTTQQPMKMAAAEVLYETSAPAPLSLFAVGPWERHPERVNVDIKLPHALSVLATNSWNGRIEGIDSIQARYREQYGPGEYTPIVGTQYWTWRIMVGIGFLMLLVGLLGLALGRRGRSLEASPRFLRLALAVVALPFVANLSGWLFTEMGRQPWIVQGLLLTRDSASANVGVASVATTLAGFTLVYAVLAVVEAWLIVRAVKTGPDAKPADDAGADLLLKPLSY